MTYADNYNLRSRTVAKLNDIANAIDGLRLPDEQIDESGIVNTTSTTLVQLTTNQISIAVTATQHVMLIGYGSFSVSSTGADVSFRIRRNGSGIGGHTTTQNTQFNDTGGYDFYIPILFIDAPGVGTHTYDLAWAVTTGTGYNLRRRLFAIPFETN